MVNEAVGAISAVHIHREFLQADGSTLVALNDVNLEIQPGEFVSLIGPSGCGKSTFLRLVAGLDQPNGGELRLDGNLIQKPNWERGLVFQNATLFPWLTIYNNVAYGLKTRGIYKEKSDEVDRFLRLVGLEGFAKSYPHQLSGGMQQRASLARALVNHPKVLLLDEPFGALDAFTRMSMQDELLNIWKDRGTTMLMVTHDVDEAIYLSDRVIVMSPRPAKIEDIITVDLPRPRSRDLPEFLSLRSKILRILHFTGHHLEPEYTI